MHGAGLEHRAARRLEEAEAGAGGLRRDRADALVAGAHTVDEGEGVAHRVEVEARVEGGQPVAVDRPDRGEVAGGLAVERPRRR